MNDLTKGTTWLSGLQWLLFMFTNTVVIPITLGAAFDLPQDKISGLLQISFILTGLGSIVQAYLGHGKTLMEGQAGMWWAVVISLAFTARQQGMPLYELGGSLAVGIIITGLIVVVVGITNLGNFLARYFNNAVMGVFMFLTGVKIIETFLKAMLGLPFGVSSENATINTQLSLLTISIAVMVIIISIKASPKYRKFGLLIGILIGWPAYLLLFPSTPASTPGKFLQFEIFPLGKPFWHSGILLTTIFAGILNLSNTYVSLIGMEDLLHKKTEKKEFRKSLTVTGFFTSIGGLLGLIPFTPYVSTIGFLNQVGLSKRLPFVIGGFLFLLLGIIPSIGNFFSMLPLSIGGAVLMAAYLQFFFSSWTYFNKLKLNTNNMYRIAIPLFIGIVIMIMPGYYFNSLPAFIKPLLSNGLLTGIGLSLLMELFIKWDKIQ